MDWKFVLIQGLLLFVILSVQNVGVGIILGSWMLVLWRRKWDRREAVIALFMLSCVLASSREPGLQYWKSLRLVPAALLFLEAMKVFFHAPIDLRGSWVKWVLFIVVCTGVPALFSDFVQAGLEETLLLSSMWFAMLVTAQVQEQDRLGNRFNSLKHLSVMVLGVSISFFLIGSNSVFLMGRFRGIFGNPNEMSHWMFPFVIMINMSGVFSSEREKTLAWIFGFGILSLTGTRGAFIALALSLVGMKVVQMRSSGVRVFLLAIMSLGVVSSQFLTIESFQEYLPERLVRSDSLDEGGGRYLAWEHGVDEIKKHPFLGGGGGYEERYFGSRVDFFTQQGHQGLSHNSWIAFALNFGVVGGFLLVLSLLKRLGILRKSIILPVALSFIISLTVEGWLTAPMSASSPVLFFIGGFLGSKYKMNEI